MDPFIGEIRLLPYMFEPVDWSICDGRKIIIRDNQALFALLGSTYGGDGKTYFNLPNLAGFAVVGAGSGPGLTPRVFAKTYGTATVTLDATNTPFHNHQFQAESPPGAGTTANSTHVPSPQSALWRALTGSPLTATRLFGPASDGTLLAPGVISPGPVNSTIAPHDNAQPYLMLRYMIATSGIFPYTP